VYVASPIPTFATTRYDHFLEVVVEHYEDWEVIPARSQWHSNEDWRLGWPALLDTLDVLVGFGEPDGIIGQGTFAEIVEAADAGCEVWIAEQPRRWWPVTLVDAPRCPGDSARWYARLVFPTPFTPGRAGPVTAS
jgi:hypothetical protein